MTKNVELTPEQRALMTTIKYRWSLHRRAEQWVSDEIEWTYWFYCAGRGSGKTRSGAEKVREWAENGVYKEIALVAPTHDDVEKVMLNGPAGIMRICPKSKRPEFNANSRILQWPDRIVYDGYGGVIRKEKGMKAICYTAEKPEKFRGPQFQAAWADEICAWRFPAAWDNLTFGVRLPPKPRLIITSTPKPTKLIKDILKFEGLHMTTGSTYANRLNLADVFINSIIKRYEGTRLGRQEIHAEILDDNPNALWQEVLVNKSRIICSKSQLPQFDEIVVGVDPNGSHKPGSDSCGIVVCASYWDGETKHYYTLADETLIAPTPKEWGQRVCEVYHEWDADRVAVETNYGGDMAISTIHNEDEDVVVKAVRATRGKMRRAEPVAQLSEQGREHHWGYFAELESEMYDWNPRETDEVQGSPDRMDAKVWAITDLMRDEAAPGVIK